jgi:hypothetical protein
MKTTGAIDKVEYLFVFVGEGSRFPAAVFSDYEQANQWIVQYELSGSLNKYPLNISLYDWAIKKEFFQPSKDYQMESNFIQKFTTASIDHWHFENGEIQD